MANPYDALDTEELDTINPYDELDEDEGTSTEAKEIDTRKLEDQRNSGQSDDAILDNIINQAGPNLSMDGKPFSLTSMMENGTQSKDIMDFIVSGNVVNTNINNPLKVANAVVGTASTNILGLPVDLLNMATSATEALFRGTANTIAGINAPEGVSDPLSENYNPDYYLSTDKRDFLLSSPTPFGGSQSIRDGLNYVYDKVGIDNLVDSKYEIPPEYRALYEGSRVVTENAIPAISALKLAKLGFGLNNPFMSSIKDSPKKFAKTEAAATGTAASLVSGAELAGLNENPWVTMGLEFTGAIVGGNASSIKNGLANSTKKVAGGLTDSFATLFSDTASQKVVINKFLIAADTKRKDILKQIDAAKIAGNDERVAELTDLAELYTPERLLQNLKDSVPVKTDAQGIKIGEDGYDESTGAFAPLDKVTTTLPLGELTGNPFFIGMQNKMLDGSSSLSGDVQNKVNAALVGILDISERLARGGNTQAAATMRSSYFQELLNTKLAATKADIDARINELGPDVSQAEASTIAQQTLFDAKDNIRKMETYLWEQIDGSIPLSGNGLAKVIKKLEANRLIDGMTLAGGGQLDDVITNIYNKVNNPSATVSVDELRKFKSVMQSAAREARGADKLFQAGIFDELVTGVIDELGTIPNPAEKVKFDTANRFSLELNKRFTRYFNQDALSTKGTGGTTMRPEQVLEGALTGTELNRYLNLTELRKGAEYADEAGVQLNNYKAQVDAENINAPDDVEVNAVGEGDVNLPSSAVDDLEATSGNIPTDEDIIPEVQVTGTGEGYYGNGLLDPENPIPEYTIYGAEQKVDATDTATGTTSADDGFNPGGQSASVPSLLDDAVKIDLGPQMSEAQENFLRGAVTKLKNTDNTIPADKLESFMAADTNAAILKDFPNFKAELDGLLTAQKNLDEIVETFGRISETGTLPAAINEVLSSANPVENFTRLSKEAITPEALEDFRLSSMDALFSKARQSDGAPNFFAMADELTKPLSGKKGDISIIELMEQNGVINAADKKIISEAMSLGAEIQKRNMDPSKLTDILNDMGDMVNNTARILGANFGAKFGVGEGSQLQAAAIGSSLFKKIVSGLPLANQARQAELMILQPDLALKVLSENPQISRGAMHTFKEWGKDYAMSYRGLTKTGAVGKALKDASFETGKMLGIGLSKAASNAPVSSSQALIDNNQDKDTPTLTTQMEQALP
jgi:hypothetical protein